MAEKLPVIIDNWGDNTVVNALCRLLPKLQKMDVATGVCEVGAFLLLEDLWRNGSHFAGLGDDRQRMRESRDGLIGHKRRGRSCRD